MAAEERPLPPRKHRSYFEDNNSKLHAASYFGDYDSALMLLLARADANVRNAWGETPLHQSTSQGHLDLVMLLLDAGADVNARDKDSLTPLHQALIHSNRDALQLLLCYGAHIHNDPLEVTGSKSPLDFAGHLSMNTCYELLKQAEGWVWPLQHLCRISIRKHLGVSKRRRIKELPLPRHLISFLTSLPVPCTEQLHANWERTKTIKSKFVKSRHENHRPKLSNTRTTLQTIRGGLDLK